MDKNLILAVSLSILVYVGWFTFLEKRYGTTAPTPAASAAKPSAAGPAGPPETAAAGPGGLDGALDFASGRLAIKIQPLGAAIASFRYPGPLGSVELVPLPGPGFLATWPNLRFTPAGGPGGLAFEARHPSGARIRKEYLFSDADAVQTLRLTIANPTPSAIRLNDLELSAGPGLGTVASEQKENPRLWSGVALLPPEEGKSRDRLLKIKIKDPEQAHAQPWKWAGLHNRYFLAAVIPARGQFESFETGSLRDAAGNLAPWVKMKSAPVAVPAKASVTVDIPFYLGPKGYTHLSKFGMGLERSVEFGYFNRLGRLTLRTLMFFHEATGNWGWSIILLTLILQLILSPLTYKSLKSAAAMKRLQPEIAKLQQKFGKDPQRLNVEMMQLYKKHGANPLGGCLPMLAQMPVFISLFNTLRNAWELHGARWVLWIKDLSAHDPFYILPVVMGAFMFAQNKLNPPPTADPAQAQMMTYMPIIMTVMFLQFPAGLVLYWLTNSILSFGQQMTFKNRLS